MVGCKNSIQRGIGWGVVGAQVEDARRKGMDRTQGGMAGPGMPYSFAAYAVLLGSETERRKVGCGDAGRRGSEVVDGRGVVPKTNVLEAKQVVASGLGGAGVFAGAEQKVIGQDEAVGDGMGSGSVVGQGKLVRQSNHG